MSITEEEALCEGCECELDDVNVEAWETFGKLLCAECAESAFEEAHYRAEREAMRGQIDPREAYDITDPKHPDYAETMQSRADAARKESP